MLDMIALIPAIASVECNHSRRLKCAGSIPTAANPVMTPLAPPAIAAAAIPFSHISKLDMNAPSPQWRQLKTITETPVGGATVTLPQTFPVPVMLIFSTVEASEFVVPAALIVPPADA